MQIATAVVRVGEAAASEALPDPKERLRRIFHQTCDGLYRFILVRVDGRHDVAEDLLQQTCHEASRARRMPYDDSECEAWLRGIARNMIRRHWRRTRRRPGRLSLEDADRARELVEDMESRPLPPEALARKESSRQLMLAVTSLPAFDQRLLLAFYFEDRSQAEIAEELGLSVKSVETRLYRVRRRLRASLRDIERI